MAIPEYVMHEAFDDETVVVNMKRGHYYALSGPSARLWNQVTLGSTEPEVLAKAISADKASVEQFLRLLVQEGLLSKGETFENVQEPKECLSHTPFAGTLERFTDVEELLLADPIHDFDASGWSKMRDE